MEHAKKSEVSWLNANEASLYFLIKSEEKSWCFQIFIVISQKIKYWQYKR